MTAPPHTFFVNVSEICVDAPTGSGFGVTSDTKLTNVSPTTEVKISLVLPVFDSV
jgi:hypothetical protein